ncbi:hypothetical protein [Yersinia entomophaga]|uniref:hypothetical protein n=1 Tax=Yersinia entomophaga TaxID=935293 RepID=UPI0015C5E3C1|nr:hypothetical protein [Yersinia entomophaga]
MDSKKNAKKKPLKTPAEKKGGETCEEGIFFQRRVKVFHHVKLTRSGGFFIAYNLIYSAKIGAGISAVWDQQGNAIAQISGNTRLW